jgi:hypothetical protein
MYSPNPWGDAKWARTSSYKSFLPKIP